MSAVPRAGRDRLLRYSFALLAVGIAALLRWAMPGLLSETPYLVFYPAVVVAAGAGGLGPGLVATGLCALCVDLFFDATPGSLEFQNPVMLFRQALFLAGGVGTSLIAGALRASRTNAHRQAEALRESEQRFRTMADAMPQLAWIANADGWIHWYNRRWYEYSGTTEKQMEGWGWQSVHDPNTLPAVLERWKASIATGEPFEMVFPLRGADGVFRPFLTRVQPLKDARGHVVQWFGTNTDVGELKRAEEALRISEEKFAAAFARNPAAISLTSRDSGRFLEVNDTWVALTGYKREEAIGRPAGELAIWPTPEDRQCFVRELQERGAIQGWERAFRKKSGEIFIAQIAAQALSIGGEAVVLSTLVDITERAAAEEQVRLQAGALDAAANGIAITNSEGVILWVNRAFCIMTGYVSEELIGQTHRVLKSGKQDEAFYRNLWATIRRGEIWRGELVNRRKDGTLYVDEQSITPLKDAQGQITHFVAIKQDITARKEAEEALAAARRSSERAKVAAEEASRAKDHFLAVLSHELRTPLAPVMAAISMLQEGRQDAQATRETLDMVRRNVEMESRLIDDLLDVTRIARGKIELNRMPVELCTAIKSAAEVCMPDIEARGIHFGIDWGEGPYWVHADTGRLQQIFWNLLKNAVKFTPHNGCVGVRCRRIDGHPGHVAVDVFDSGIGIEPHMLGRVFDAFEQAERLITRQFGGLGLGLAISRALVELHQGSIEAHSEGKGKGATFTVWLPLLTAGVTVPAPAEPAAPAVPATVGSLRILLVEDHGDTAKIMRRLLESAGHQVKVAGDVTAALALAEESGFDLLLSDLGLPDASGLDLMRELRSHNDNVPGIALSGYGQDQDIQRSYEAGFAAHLTKPTNPDVLVRTISEVIHRAAGLGHLSGESRVVT